MPSLSDAYNYVITACNYPYVGYNWNWPERTTIDITVNYRTYCDCSSLMSKALTVGGYFTNNPWFVTDTELTYLERAGWVRQPINGVWLPGDILHHYGSPGHTEMVYTGGTASGVTMGAHSSSYDFPDQVSIRSKPSGIGSWTSLWRDPTGTAAAYKWHQSNSAYNEYDENMTANAFMVWQFFKDLGFSAASIAGLLGNMQAESTINPGRWQGGSGPGYGLVQWDPASKYRNWANSQGIDMNDADENGNGQCTYVNMCEQVGQWGSYGGYSYTWAQFSQLTDWNEATLAFLYQFERPSVPHTADRLRYAEHWYEIIQAGFWGAADEGIEAGTLKTKIALINDLQRRLVIPGRH